jgi:hypothetical protein
MSVRRPYRPVSSVQGLQSPARLESPEAPIDGCWTVYSLIKLFMASLFYFLGSAKQDMQITRSNRCYHILSSYYRKTTAIFGARRQPKYKQLPSPSSRFFPPSPFFYLFSALPYRPRRLTSLCPCVPYLFSPYLFSAPPSLWHKAITRSTSQKTR